MRAADVTTLEALLAENGFVRSLARATLGRDDDGDDVAQDAWVAALERPPREAHAARGWLYRVVQNRVRTLWRRRATERRALREAPPAPPVPSPAEILEREETRRRLVDALLALEPLYREPLVLRFYEGLKPGAIAARLEVPVETVRTRLKRGLARLRAALGQRAGSRRAWSLALLPLARLPDERLGAPASAGAAVAAWALVGGVVGAAAWLASGPAADGRATSPPAAVRAVASAPTLEGHRGATPGDAPPDGRGAPRAPAGAARDVTIVVLDDAGLAVVGGAVRVAEWRPDFDQERDVVRTTTDAEGRAHVPHAARARPGEDVPTAALRLEVTPPPDRPDLQERRIRDWPLGDTTVMLPRGFTISGEVLNHALRPVAGAFVTLADRGRTLRLTADRRGRFETRGLPPGRWRAVAGVACPEGELPGEERVLESGSENVSLLVGADGGLEVGGAGLTGHVGASGRARIRVTAYDPGTGRVGAGVEHDLGPDGSLWLYGLREPTRLALWWGPDGRGRCAYLPAVEARQGRVDLRPQEGATVGIAVERPAGFTGWPPVRATALGLEVFGTYGPDGGCVLSGVPAIELLVTAVGRDERSREVVGETHVVPGHPASLTLRFR